MRSPVHILFRTLYVARFRGCALSLPDSLPDWGLTSWGSASEVNRTL